MDLTGSELFDRREIVNRVLRNSEISWEEFIRILRDTPQPGKYMPVTFEDVLNNITDTITQRDDVGLTLFSIIGTIEDLSLVTDDFKVFEKEVKYLSFMNDQINEFYSNGKRKKAKGTSFDDNPDTLVGGILRKFGFKGDTIFDSEQLWNLAKQGKFSLKTLVIPRKIFEEFFQGPSENVNRIGLDDIILAGTEIDIYDKKDSLIWGSQYNGNPGRTSFDRKDNVYLKNIINEGKNVLKSLESKFKKIEDDKNLYGNVLRYFSKFGIIRRENEESQILNTAPQPVRNDKTPGFVTREELTALLEQYNNSLSKIDELHEEIRGLKEYLTGKFRKLAEQCSQRNNNREEFERLEKTIKEELEKIPVPGMQWKEHIDDIKNGLNNLRDSYKKDLYDLEIGVNNALNDVYKASEDIPKALKSLSSPSSSNIPPLLRRFMKMNETKPTNITLDELLKTGINPIYIASGILKNFGAEHEVSENEMLSAELATLAYGLQNPEILKKIEDNGINYKGILELGAQAAQSKDPKVMAQTMLFVNQALETLPGISTDNLKLGVLGELTGKQEYRNKIGKEMDTFLYNNKTLSEILFGKKMEGKEFDHKTIKDYLYMADVVGALNIAFGIATALGATMKEPTEMHKRWGIHKKPDTPILPDNLTPYIQKAQAAS